MLKDGTLRALAVSSPQRLPAFPDVPTFAELGYPSLTSAQWLGLSAPKGLPAPIAERLAVAVPEILARPELRSRFEDLQTLPRSPVPVGGDFLRIIEADRRDWTAVARRFNIVAA
jgi:tripartite-type tricarboxylate transporter receptor subunit TctC